MLNELDSDIESPRTSFPTATMLYYMDHVNRSNTLDCDRLLDKRRNSFDSSNPSERKNPVRPLPHTYLWIPFELQKLHFRILEYTSEKQSERKTKLSYVLKHGFRKCGFSESRMVENNLQSKLDLWTLNIWMSYFPPLSWFLKNRPTCATDLWPTKNTSVE